MNENEANLKTCIACGLPLKEHPPTSPICEKCTPSPTQDPDFEMIVVSMAMGYFMKVKGIEDPLEALRLARQEVVRLPCWREKKTKGVHLPNANERHLGRLFFLVSCPLELT